MAADEQYYSSTPKFRFEVEPLALPEAGKLITDFTYNLFTRKLFLTLTENEALHAYRWIVSIKDIYDQANLHSHLRAKDQIALHLFNGDKKLGTVRFGRLLVVNHTCRMNSAENGNMPAHTVEIGFEKFELNE